MSTFLRRVNIVLGSLRTDKYLFEKVHLFPACLVAALHHTLFDPGATRGHADQTTDRHRQEKMETRSTLDVHVCTSKTQTHAETLWRN